MDEQMDEQVERGSSATFSRRSLLAGAAVGGIAASLVDGGSARAAPGDAGSGARGSGLGVGFLLAVDGIGRFGGFTSVEGLASESDVIEIREGTESGGTTRKLPGDLRTHDLVLARPLTAATDLAQWRATVESGDSAAARADADLAALDGHGDVIARYHLENAWPRKLEIGMLRAGSSEVLTETVTIVCEHIQRAPL